MALLESVLFGLALGFSLAVPPGPMNALIATFAARSYRAGVLVAFGAMSADLVLGALILSFSAAVDLHAYVRWIYAVGAVVLAYVGARGLRRPAETGTPPPGSARTFSQGLAVGLTNPFQILWWLTAGLAFVRLGGPVLLAALFGAIAVWVVGFPYAVHAGAHRSERAQRAVTVVSAVILLAFAAYFAVLAA